MTSEYENTLNLINNQEMIIKTIMRYQFFLLDCQREKKISKVANVYAKKYSHMILQKYKL